MRSRRETRDESRVGVPRSNGKYLADTICRPGTALLFALTIVEVISGKAKREEVAGPMVVAETL